jgi:hypothetical protein
MAYEGPNSVLFKNNRKERDTHPDMTGHVELDKDCVDSIMDQINRGVKYPKLDVSAWTKISGKGNKFISIALKKPWEGGRSGGGGRGGYRQDNRSSGGSDRGYDQGRDYDRDNSRNNDIEDEIPF